MMYGGCRGMMRGMMHDCMCRGMVGGGCQCLNINSNIVCYALHLGHLIDIDIDVVWCGIAYHEDARHHGGV